MRSIRPIPPIRSTCDVRFKPKGQGCLDLTWQIQFQKVMRLLWWCGASVFRLDRFRMVSVCTKVFLRHACVYRAPTGSDVSDTPMEGP